MKTALRISGILIIVSCFWAFQPEESGAVPFPGATVGPIVATVVAGDDRDGLTVRSGPSQGAPPVGVLALGSRVTNYPRFENGWVMLENPMNGGWIRLDALQPVQNIAVVSVVDGPEMCLRVRSGPGVGYDILGCAQMGERLRLTGFWSSNDWAEIEGPVRGWVSAAQIRINLVSARCAAPAPVTTVVRETVAPITYAYPVQRAYPVYSDYPSSRSYSSYQYPYQRRHHSYRLYPQEYGGFRYRSPGVGVAVGPRGGVGVRVGPVGVGVGPGGGVAVSVGGHRGRGR
jgi:uncharacterized protein YraI